MFFDVASGDYKVGMAFMVLTTRTEYTESPLTSNIAV